jgi:hypothetical protein
VTTCNILKSPLQDGLKKGMAKSLSSDNIRLPNPLIEPARKLNEIFRSGQQQEVLSGLDALITALERKEAIATYNGIDAKLEAIVERLDKMQQGQPAAAPIVLPPKPSAVAAATPAPKPSAPKPPAPTVTIWLEHPTLAAHSFDIPGGEKRLRMGIWEEIPESWLPKIKEQVRLSAKWGMPGFRLEVAG